MKPVYRPNPFNFLTRNIKYLPPAKFEITSEFTNPESTPSKHAPYSEMLLSSELEYDISKAALIKKLAKYSNGTPRNDEDGIGERQAFII